MEREVLSSSPGDPATGCVGMRWRRGEVDEEGGGTGGKGGVGERGGKTKQRRTREVGREGRTGAGGG